MTFMTHTVSIQVGKTFENYLRISSIRNSDMRFLKKITFGKNFKDIVFQKLNNWRKNWAQFLKSWVSNIFFHFCRNLWVFLEMSKKSLRKSGNRVNLSHWAYLVLRLVPLVSLASAGFRVFWFLTGDGAGVTAFSGADFFLLWALLGGWVFSCTDGWGCFFFFSRVFRRLILVSSFLRAIWWRVIRPPFSTLGGGLLNLSSRRCFRRWASSGSAKKGIRKIGLWNLKEEYRFMSWHYSFWMGNAIDGHSLFNQSFKWDCSFWKAINMQMQW